MRWPPGEFRVGAFIRRLQRVNSFCCDTLFDSNPSTLAPRHSQAVDGNSSPLTTPQEIGVALSEYRMRRSLAPIALAVLVLGASSGALAQVAAGSPPQSDASVISQKALTLGAAMAQAQEGNPGIAAARNELRAAEGLRVQADALPNPVLDAQIEDQRRETRTTTVTVAQPIELGGKRSARIAAADRAVEIARLQLEARQTEVDANVTAAFFAALVAQERLTLAQTSLDLARRSTDAASKRVIAGKVSPVDETRARVAEAGVRIELLQAQGELKSSLEELRGAIGAGARIESLNGSALKTPTLLPVEAISMGVEAAPAVREARLEVRRAEALTQLERAKRIPDVTLTVGATRPNEMARNQAVVGISIPLPLFDTNRGNIQAALSQQDKSEDQARATEVRVRTEAMAARQRFETALAEVDALRTDVLPGAQSAFDAATKGFELGKFSYLEALDAQRTLLQSRAQYLRALADTHRAATDVQRLLGRSNEAIQPSQSLERP